MRLFAAIPVGPPVDSVLHQLLARWRTTNWPVKWVRGEGLHLTLKFLGSVENGRVDAIITALAQATSGTPHLPFTLTELGGFPTLARARVLWAGLESEAALELLVHRVEQGFAGLGFPVEGRPYRPHVTLGRVGENQRIPAAAIESLSATVLDPVSFTSAQVVLFESLTGAGGSRYEPRATFPLGQR